ncbi:MAG: LysR family transcriptional regulator, partial [Rhodospirillales bacterium]|nr:LysR family transcriptional regulator [Rhodospirillales bacterium]
VDPATLERTFAIRASEAFLEFLATSLVASVSAAAPRVSLHFLDRPDKDARALREGTADLEIGLRGTSAPEIRTRLLFRDMLVGLVRTGHPLLEAPTMTPEAYAACRHVATAQEGHARDVDAALAALGLARRIMVVVPNYPDAMRIALGSDLVALVPRSCLGHGLLGDPRAVSGLTAFALPVPSPAFVISAMWHPRMEADPAHRWLRETVAALCRRAFPTR